MQTRMSFGLIGLTSTLCLFIFGCSAIKYENPVPLQIGNYTEIKCDLNNVVSWQFKDQELGVNDPKRKYTLSEDKSLLTIQKTDFHDEGNYTCKSESGATKIFVAKGKPRFKITTTRGRIDLNSIHAEEGSDIDMICFIPNKTEIPEDERYSFIWYKGNEAVNAMTESRQSVLLVSSINQSDRDLYSCHASNGVLNHTESIRLRVKDKLSYIWPSIGIVCEIVILVLIILIFEKRGVKPEYEESDNDANNTTDVKKSS